MSPPLDPPGSSRRLDDRESAMASREEKLLERERSVIKKERAYIGRRMALADKARVLADRSAALYERAGRLGGTAQALSRVTMPRPDDFAGEAPPGYAQIEVAQAERGAALEAREEAMVLRLDALTSRLKTIEQEQGALDYREELYDLRAQELARVERLLADGGGGKAASDTRPDHPRAPQAPKAPTPEQVGDDERRHEPRYGLKVYVGLESQHNFYTGFSRNISAGGVFIASREMLDVGAEVELLFSLPTGSPIHTAGCVTWQRKADPDRPDTHPGMGVKFVDLAPGDAEKIRLFLEHRSPLLYDG